jgi:hypothetical protein
MLLIFWTLGFVLLVLAALLENHERRKQLKQHEKQVKG